MAIPPVERSNHFTSSDMSWATLPSDLLVEIFKQVISDSPAPPTSCALVCKKWYQAYQDAAIWKFLLFKYFPHVIVQNNSLETYKSCYLKHKLGKNLEKGIYRQAEFVADNYLINEILLFKQGKKLISASNGREVRIWDLETRHCEKALEGHTNSIMRLLLNRDENKLFSASFDGIIKSWNLVDHKCELTLRGHGGGVKNIILNKNEDKLFSSSYDCWIKIWNLKTGCCEHSLEGNIAGTQDMVLSRDQKKLISPANFYSIKVWDIESGVCESSFGGHQREVLILIFNSAMDFLFSASADRTIKIWNPTTGKCKATLRGHQEVVTKLMLNRKEDRLFSASADRTIRIWNLETDSLEKSLFGHKYNISQVFLNEDETLLFSSANDGTIKIWDWKTASCKNTLEGHKQAVTHLLLFEDEGLLISSSLDHTTKIWDFLADHEQVFLELAEKFCRNAPDTGMISKRFSLMPEEKKRSIYQQLQKIDPLVKDDFQSAEDAFYDRNNFTTSNQKRAEAIYRFLLLEIQKDLDRKIPQRPFKAFNRLPNFIKSAIRVDDGYNQKINYKSLSQAISKYLNI